jgi:hypothetical protein
MGGTSTTGRGRNSARLDSLDPLMEGRGGRHPAGAEGPDPSGPEAGFRGRKARLAVVWGQPKNGRAGTGSAEAAGGRGVQASSQPSRRLERAREEG